MTDGMNYSIWMACPIVQFIGGRRHQKLPMLTYIHGRGFELYETFFDLAKKSWNCTGPYEVLDFGLTLTITDVNETQIDVY